ncbi:hypothetical protein M422DRAFT_44042 [Sphaerobolus stellatus SS14]|nr:hypothetical protein M422DRAFT_44042 [Sphaerobolus stellatus SS14]
MPREPRVWVLAGHPSPSLMDFDDRFSFNVFQKHIYSFGDHSIDVEKLVQRTTKDTHGGVGFSFKPVRVSVGISTNKEFFAGFSSEVDASAPNHHKAEPKESDTILSSFWLQFGDPTPEFQFRVICKDHESLPSLRPYQGRIPFRDIIPGTILLQAQRGDDWNLRPNKEKAKVLARLTLQSRSPPRIVIDQVPPIPQGSNPIYDRQSTEGDFWTDPYGYPLDEAAAGSLSPVGNINHRSVLQPGLWLTHRFEFLLTLRHYKLFWQCMTQDFSSDEGAASHPQSRPGLNNVGKSGSKHAGISGALSGRRSHSVWDRIFARSRTVTRLSTRKPSARSLGSHPGRTFPMER